MQIPIISVGNSKGIRLSKLLLKRYNIQDKIELVMEDDHIILRPVHAPRQGWATDFQAMQEAGDDELLIPDVFEDESFEDEP